MKLKLINTFYDKLKTNYFFDFQPIILFFKFYNKNIIKIIINKYMQNFNFLAFTIKIKSSVLFKLNKYSIKNLIFFTLLPGIFTILFYFYIQNILTNIYLIIFKNLNNLLGINFNNKFYIFFKINQIFTFNYIFIQNLIYKLFLNLIKQLKF